MTTRHEDPADLAASVMESAYGWTQSTFDEVSRLDGREFDGAVRDAVSEAQDKLIELKTALDFLQDALWRQQAREKRQAEQDISADLAATTPFGVSR